MPWTKIITVAKTFTGTNDRRNKYYTALVVLTFILFGKYQLSIQPRFHANVALLNIIQSWGRRGRRGFGDSTVRKTVGDFLYRPSIVTFHLPLRV